MQRVTISLDEELAQAFDQLCDAQGYTSRSEAMRDLVRHAVDQRRLEDARSSGEGALCVANLSYVYDHHVRSLAQRLTEIAHAHHDLIVATTHVHLDHDNCLETVILKGPTASVRALADGVRAERGVRFGEINLISVEPGEHQHASANGRTEAGRGRPSSPT